MSKYNADYFLKKFGRKPGRLWCTRVFRSGKRYCALGLCGVDDSVPGFPDEAEGLVDLFYDYPDADVSEVNDRIRFAVRMGVSPRVARKGPKARIMAALRIIKAGGG